MSVKKFFFKSPLPLFVFGLFLNVFFVFSKLNTNSNRIEAISKNEINYSKRVVAANQNIDFLNLDLNNK
ncbi:MAG: hypothetical protein JXQ87_17790 [Bacteroidia bacterium]